jgi:hypothetical protein
MTKWPPWLLDFLVRESGRRKPHQNVLLQAASDPTRANMLAAANVFRYGEFRCGP